MYEARIEFTIGAISFTGEGDKDWVASQLDKILDKAPDLVKIPPAKIHTGKSEAEVEAPSQTNLDSSVAQKTLPSFLQEKEATSIQVKKFLATAAWLTKKGKDRISTSEVTQALRDSNQIRLGNASDCLNKNVSKGYCEKDGREFFVTQDGMESL